MELSDLKLRLDQSGFIGPLPLKGSTREGLSELILAASLEDNPCNLHARLPSALSFIRHPSIIESITSLCGSGYQLWRTNFFRRLPGAAHPGIQYHHDKHFQSGDQSVDFCEIGNHLSIVIG